MKTRLVLTESQYDIGDRQQYRVQIKPFILWHDLDGLYAKNTEEAWKAAEKIVKNYRARQTAGVRDL